MIDKKEIEHTDDIQPDHERRLNLNNRCREERRKRPSNGYTYISSVGWIDRREKLRRKDDPDAF